MTADFFKLTDRQAMARQDAGNELAQVIYIISLEMAQTGLTERQVAACLAEEAMGIVSALAIKSCVDEGDVPNFDRFRLLARDAFHAAAKHLGVEYDAREAYVVPDPAFGEAGNG